MTRYFFDFRQGDDLFPDEQGIEFASAEEAFLDAYQAAIEMWSELLLCRRDPRRCSFQIRAPDGSILFDISFMEILNSCYDCDKHMTRYSG